jgi:hypothetical protein
MTNLKFLQLHIINKKILIKTIFRIQIHQNITGLSVVLDYEFILEIFCQYLRINFTSLQVYLCLV